MEKREQMLHDARGEILGKLISERERSPQWLVQLIDIEDELEELFRSSSTPKNIKVKKTNSLL